MWTGVELNHGRADFQSAALPTELQVHLERERDSNPRSFRLELMRLRWYQAPVYLAMLYSQKDLNLRSSPYQSAALPS